MNITTITIDGVVYDIKDEALSLAISEHVSSGGASHALATEYQAGFISPEEKIKLSEVVYNEVNVDVDTLVITSSLNSSASIQIEVELVNYTESSATVFDIYPNKMYLMGTRNTFTLNFKEPADLTKASIYCVNFTCGASCVPTFQKETVAKTVDKGVTTFSSGLKLDVAYNWATDLLLVQ